MQIASLMTINSCPLMMDVATTQRVLDSMFEFRVVNTRYDIKKMIQWEPGTVGMQGQG
jgi:hypothetical protein